MNIVRRENLKPLLAVAFVADGACLMIGAAFGEASGILYDDVVVSGMQFGLLSCLALWMALIARDWISKLAIPVVVLTASWLTLASSTEGPRGIELATLTVSYLVAVWLTAGGLRMSGLLRTFEALEVQTAQRFSLRQLFAWTTVFTVLAFLSRFAELPRGAQILELALFVGGGVVLAVAIAEFIARVTMSLQILLTAMTVFALALAVGRTIGGGSDRWDHFLSFYGIQAAMLLTWINASRAAWYPPFRSRKIGVMIETHLLRRLDELVKEGCFDSRGHFLQEAAQEKLERLDGSRLARECAKLDPAEEKELAEEGLSADFETCPQY